MRYFKGLLATTLLAVSGAASAVPVTWVDYIDFTPDELVTTQEPLEYTHSILDDGFTPFTDFIYSFSLGLDLFDDGGRRDGGEWISIDLPGLLDDRWLFSASGGEFGGWSLEGYLTLATTGLYEVTISAISGDFYVGSSTLTVEGEELGGTSVPEPATLGLFGLGLLGFAATRRKKA